MERILTDTTSLLGHPSRFNRDNNHPRLLQQGIKSRRIQSARRGMANPDRCSTVPRLRNTVSASDHARKQEVLAIRRTQHAEDAITSILERTDGHGRRHVQRPYNPLNRRGLELAIGRGRESCKRRSSRGAPTSRRALQDLHDLF